MQNDNTWTFWKYRSPHSLPCPWVRESSSQSPTLPSHSVEPRNFYAGTTLKPRKYIRRTHVFVTCVKPEARVLRVQIREKVYFVSWTREGSRNKGGGGRNVYIMDSEWNIVVCPSIRSAERELNLHKGRLNAPIHRLENAEKSERSEDSEELETSETVEEQQGV